MFINYFSFHYKLDDVSQINFDELKEEIDALKNIIYHLNIELSSYQAKYPSPSLLAHDVILFYSIYLFPSSNERFLKWFL